MRASPSCKAFVVREEHDKPIVDLMKRDVLGGAAGWHMTNLRNLALSQWRALAAELANRCLVPLMVLCEYTPYKHDLDGGKKPLQGEMWFNVTDQPVITVAVF